MARCETRLSRNGLESTSKIQISLVSLPLGSSVTDKCLGARLTRHGTASDEMLLRRGQRLAVSSDTGFVKYFT